VVDPNPKRKKEHSVGGLEEPSGLFPRDLFLSCVRGPDHLSNCHGDEQGDEGQGEQGLVKEVEEELRQVGGQEVWEVWVTLEE
jgi:hypothetical protein